MTRREISTRIGAWIAAGIAVTAVLAQPASNIPTWLSDRFGGNENDLGGSLVRTEGSGVIDEDLVKTARATASRGSGKTRKSCIIV